MHAQRLWRAIAGHKNAQLAARRLDRGESLAWRWRKSLGKNFEMVDERFHLRLHFLALGRNDSGRFGAEWTVRSNLVHRLANNLQALAHFRNPDHIPGKTIGIGARRHVELEFVIAAIRENSAIVISKTGGAQRRTGHAVRNRVFSGNVT